MQTDFDAIVVGAGMSGLSCASALHEAGWKVLVLEKSRGTGGRLASKRLGEDAWGVASADLGCEVIRASSQLFQDHLSMWGKVGWLSYQPDSLGWSVVERSSRLTRSLGQGMNLKFERRASELRSSSQGVEVVLESGEIFSAAKVILSAPPAQSAALLNGWGSTAGALQNELGQVAMLPQWVVMVSIPAAHVQKADDLLSAWTRGGGAMFDSVSVESQKPGRKTLSNTDRETLVLRMTPQWTARHLHQDQEGVVEAVMQLLQQVGHLDVTSAKGQAHRWLYSRVDSQSLLPGSYRTIGTEVFLCGDYFDHRDLPWVRWEDGLAGDALESDVERAFLSGRAVAEACLSKISVAE